MKATVHRRGSVLMEFLIVFPIYLVLFGGVFMIGDMLLKTTRLSFADRTRAFDVAVGSGIANDGWSAVEKLLFPTTTIKEDVVSSVTYRYHAQGGSFHGPWTVAVGAKAKDNYKLAPWTRGWLSYTHPFSEKATGVKDELDDGDDVMVPLMDKKRVEMFSKDRIDGRNEDSVRFYNYYTYRRTRDYSQGDLKNSYRAMPSSLDDAGRLVDSSSGGASWKKYVEGEKYPGLEGIGSESGNDKGSSSTGLSGREYSRYGQYKSWTD